jgi:hypothetical protein
MESAHNMNRAMLAKKLLCTCPICQKRIYNTTLGLEKIDLSRINQFPFAYTYVHSCESGAAQNSMDQNEIIQAQHAVTLFFDANLTVRGLEHSPWVKID